MYIMFKKTENTAGLLDFLRKADANLQIREYNHIISVYTNILHGYVSTDYNYRNDTYMCYLNLYFLGEVKHINIVDEISAIHEL